MVQIVSGVKNVDIEIQLRHQQVEHQKEKSKSANPIQSENFFYKLLCDINQFSYIFATDEEGCRVPFRNYSLANKFLK